MSTERERERERDAPSFFPNLQVLDSSFLLCLSWLPSLEVPEKFKNCPVYIYIYIYLYVCVFILSYTHLVI
jgi:hypothetical protein